MGNPRSLRKRRGCLAGRWVIGDVANIIVEDSSDVDIEYVGCVANGELDGRERGAGQGGCAGGLHVDCLLDTEIVALPQRQGERSHVKTVNEAGRATENIIAQVIDPNGGVVRWRSASVVLAIISLEINDDDGGGIRDCKKPETTSG